MIAIPARLISSAALIFGVGAGASTNTREDGYHYCSVCQKGFSSTKALFGHMRLHQTVVRRACICRRRLGFF